MQGRYAPLRLVLSAALALMALGACNASFSIGGARGVPTAGASPTSGVPVRLEVGGGSCKVTISGGLTASWESKQDDASVLVSYWLSPSDHAALGGNSESFLMNCQGTGAQVSLYTTTGTTGSQFPEGSGSYVIDAQGPASKGQPGMVGGIVSTGGSDLWNITEPGTFTVTDLNATHFAGRFQMTIAQIGTNLQVTSNTATVTGSFDMDCTTAFCK